MIPTRINYIEPTRSRDAANVDSSRGACVTFTDKPGWLVKIWVDAEQHTQARDVAGGASAVCPVAVLGSASPRTGSVVIAYVADDPACGQHTVWLATYDAKFVA